MEVDRRRGTGRLGAEDWSGLSIDDLRWWWGRLEDDGSRSAGRLGTHDLLRSLVIDDLLRRLLVNYLWRRLLEDDGAARGLGAAVELRNAGHDGREDGGGSATDGRKEGSAARGIGAVVGEATGHVADVGNGILERERNCDNVCGRCCYRGY